MFLAGCTLVIFLSMSVGLTILAIKYFPFLLSEIWLFDAVYACILVNVALLCFVILMDYVFLGSRIYFHAIYAAIIAILSHVALFGIVVVSFDRSISVYFLSSMYEANKALTVEEMEGLLWEGYFIGQSATQRRIKEQTQIGNMAWNDDGELFITKKGRSFIEFSRVIAKLYNTQRQFLWPND